MRTRTKVLIRPTRRWLERAVKRCTRKGFLDMGLRGQEKVGLITWHSTIMVRRSRW